ncbi:hypothetical protein RFN28_01100 [Mesorhizobium sp. VK24D]|uniref:Uncharacterized protein n=1 Tax=Mesorhizobium album TaxID=3072314 RepID=A0ABU4XTX1_9HYPH|nr:hypothetical protein [Mesorhizobium sp. VK24D]MDX8477067.1 hypothetical protein [Mesorhizobium sp. VK24D]
MSARHSIEPISVSFKRGDAAAHHTYMKRRNTISRAMDRIRDPMDHWHKSQRSEKLIGATPCATHTLDWSSQVKTAGHPRNISHATAQ